MNCDSPYKRTGMLLEHGDSAIMYVVATIMIEVQPLWCHLYAECFLPS